MFGRSIKDKKNHCCNNKKIIQEGIYDRWFKKNQIVTKC